jgi:salicylate hydroxylase
MQAEGPSRLRTIVIAGAGIGGLTAALALAAKGFRVVVLEKAERLEDIGAGLQVSSNASRILIELGLEADLATHIVTPENVSVISARVGKEIGRIPLGEKALRRYGAPYWIIRRADLQSALLARVKTNPDIELRLGASVEDVLQTADGVTAVWSDGGTRHEEQALALIGADGVRSIVRQRLFPKTRAVFAERIAWRGTVDIKSLPQQIGWRGVHLWMGPNAHLVAYPMSGGQRINVVAISTGRWNAPGWNEEADATEIEKEFASGPWPADARTLIASVESWRRWALFEVDGKASWSSNHVALLGDAAHAMLPFVAQGAGMAIEDAAVLADCLAATPNDIAHALQRYSDERRARVSRVQRTARQTGRTYHLRGLFAFARDAVIGSLSGDRLLARQDWIYGWRRR